MPRAAGRRYEIRQLPGPAARRSLVGYARPRLRAVMAAGKHQDEAGLVEIRDAADALNVFVEDTYTGGRNRQYVSHRLEWQGASASSDRWHPDDGSDRVDHRRWRAVVTLANGRAVHDIVLEAWRVA